MKYGIAILVLFGAGLVCEVNAVLFSDVERYWTECEPNSVLYTRSASEISQPLQIKKRIDDNHPLYLTAELTNTNSGAVVFSAKDLNICTKYSDAFEKAVVRVFNKCFFGNRQNTCPVPDSNREILRYQLNIKTGAELSPGNYEVKYSVKSDTGEVVFSTLKFRFHVDSPSAGWGWGK